MQCAYEEELSDCIGKTRSVLMAKAPEKPTVEQLFCPRPQRSCQEATDYEQLPNVAARSSLVYGRAHAIVDRVSLFAYAFSIC